MADPIEIVQQGESLPFAFDRNGESVTGWTCTIEVKQYPDDSALVSRGIALDGNQKFSGFLTGTETGALSAGLYYLIATLTNATTDEPEVIPVRFQVAVGW